MEVRFTPEQEPRLERIADHNGAAVEDLVRDAAVRLIAEDDEFGSAVRAGVAAADRATSSKKMRWKSAYERRSNPDAHPLDAARRGRHRTDQRLLISEPT